MFINPTPDKYKLKTKAYQKISPIKHIINITHVNLYLCNTYYASI